MHKIFFYINIINYLIIIIMIVDMYNIIIALGLVCIFIIRRMKFNKTEL